MFCRDYSRPIRLLSPQRDNREGRLSSDQRHIGEPALLRPDTQRGRRLTSDQRYSSVSFLGGHARTAIPGRTAHPDQPTNHARCSGEIPGLGLSGRNSEDSLSSSEGGETENALYGGRKEGERCMEIQMVSSGIPEIIEAAPVSVSSGHQLHSAPTAVDLAVIRAEDIIEWHRTIRRCS